MNIREAVDIIIKDALLNLEEAKEAKQNLDNLPAKFVKTEGIAHGFVFNRERLKHHRSEAVDIINELPEGFRKASGGGWTFLNLCTDKNGNIWGEQMDAEALYVIANGLGLAKFIMPRIMWEALPGGVPYIQFE